MEEGLILVSERKYLIIGQYLFGQQNSTGYFWEKICIWLRSDSDFVTVAGPKPVGNAEFHPGIGYDLFDFPSFDRGNLLLRIIYQVKLSIILLLRIFYYSRKVDYVFIGTTPELFLSLLPIFKILLPRIKFIILIHDVFPHTLIPAQIVKPGYFFNFFKIYFEWIYRNFDFLIVIGRDMLDFFVNKIKIPENRVTCIQNWVSMNDVKYIPRADSSTIYEMGWNNAVVFQFFGNMGRVQGLDNLLKSIPLVKNSRAVFHFVGGGFYSSDIKKLAGELESSRLIFWDAVDSSCRNKVLAACDVALISLTDGMKGLAVPSKAYFSLAAGRPLLALMDFDSEVSRMVVEDEVGWVCSINDPVQIAKKIDEICDLKIMEMQMHCRSIFENKYSEDIARIKFMDFLLRLKNNDA